MNYYSYIRKMIQKLKVNLGNYAQLMEHPLIPLLALFRQLLELLHAMNIPQEFQLTLFQCLNLKLFCQFLLLIARLTSTITIMVKTGFATAIKVQNKVQLIYRLFQCYKTFSNLKKFLLKKDQMLNFNTKLLKKKILN